MIFGGELKAVTTFNSKGRFDVLPEHAHFVSMITNKVILRREDGRTDEIDVQNGVIMVEDDTVKIFLGITKA